MSLTLPPASLSPLVAVLALGCSRPQEPVAVRDPAAGASVPAPPSASAPTSSTPPTDPAASSSATLGGPVVVSLGPSFGEFVVEAKAAVDVRTAIEIERLDGGKWEPQVADVLLVDACPKGGKVPTCRKLSAGQIVRPPRYTGYTCSSQCAVDCDKNVQIAGTVRYVVRSCDGAQRWHSAPVKVTPSSP